MKANNYEQGYLSIKNKAVLELKAHLYRTYSYIVSKDFKGEGIWHSQETMASELGVSTRTISRHIKQLKEIGYLSVKRRGFNMTNIYTCLKNIVSKVKEGKEKAIESFKKQFTTTTSKPKAKSKNGFCNFTGRDYSQEYMDKLERQLLGWEE